VLCVGLPPSLSRLLTAPLVEAFQARFPRARLSVVEGLSTTLLEWLTQGRVDIAAVYNALPSAAVELQPVLQERLHLVSARPARSRAGRARSPAGGAAIALHQVAEHDLVIPGRPNAIRMRLEAALAEAGLRPRVALEVDSITALLDLVQRHALHAVLGAAAVQGDAREAQFVARPVLLPGGAPLVVPLYMATSAQRPRGPLLQQAGTVMVELLQGALGRV
jgi:LysR family nitrogen assimilation transcriptional regulator